MVSVIIPVHNRAHFIEKCIKSVLNQTFKDLEIIIVDDHSNDNLEDAVINASNGDERVSLYSLTGNRGVSAARNLGISKAKGEWICFLDSDDYWEENLLEELLNVYNKTKADVVIAGFDMVRKDGQVIKESLQKDGYIELTGNELLEDYTKTGFGQFCCWGRLIKRELLDGLSFPIGVAMAEDRIFMTYVYAKAERIAYLPGVFFHVVLHESNAQWGSFNPELEYMEMKEFEKIRAFYNSVVPNKMARREVLRFWYREKTLILRRMYKVNNMQRERK